MPYALIADDSVVEYPLNPGDIQSRYPNTSFAAPFTPPEGYELVADVVPPQIDHTQNLAEGAPALVDGVWTRTWVISDATATEIEDRTSAKAQGIRAARNQLLSASDWTQIPDAPLDADARSAWQLYRESLRMVPQQEGFPWEVQWPVEPT